MDHLLNWIEIPVTDMKMRKTDLHEMKLGPNDQALFAVTDDSGCLVKGDGYVPRTDGVVVCLNGAQDLSGARACRKSGGKVLLKKTFLSEEAGHMAYFKRHGGQQIGLHRMN